MSNLLQTDFNYFYIKNYTGSYSTSSYSLSITPFTFIPTGLTDIGNRYSNKKVLWDFGDKTTSKSITATHFYNLPGTYTVTLQLIDNLGNGVVDSYKQTVTVYDFIADNFVVTTTSSWVNESSHLDNYFTISRFNSWRNYDLFIDTGYKFNLYAENTNAPLLDAVAYEKSTYSHLLPYAGFFQKQFNVLTSSYDIIPVNSVTTTTTELFYKLSGTEIVKCLPTDAGSCFAGTSGTADVYFVDDLVSPLSGDNTKIFISQDMIKFNDYSIDESGMGNILPRPQYQIIQQIPKTVFYKTICQSTLPHINITSNGISTFTIDSNQFAGVKIPFVVRLYDDFNYPSKYFQYLTLIDSNSSLSANNIQITVLSAGIPITNAIVTSNFNELTSVSDYGGYFKGTIECLSAYNDVSIEATVMTDSSLDGLTLVWVLQPESKYIHNIAIGSTNDTLVNTQTLTGASAVSVIPDCHESGFAWVVDADIDVIKKFDAYGVTLSSYSLSSMQLSGGSTVNLLGALSSAAPSCVTLDKNKDIWVTLFDAVSTIKINQLTGKIDAIAIPSLTNIALTATTDYGVVSGYAGDNSLTPSCVDTDTNNNIWVSYSNPISSYLMKYNTNGTLLSTIPFSVGYSADTFVIDKYDDLWVVYKNYTTTTSILSNLDDNIKKIDGTTGAITNIPVSGFIGDITFDYSSNIWFTRNKNTVVKMDPVTYTTTTFTLTSSTNNNTNYLSDLEGIGGIGVNQVYVISNADKLVYNITSNTVENITVDTVPDLTINSNENKLFAYGDWTGIRWLLKYSSLNIITGTSNTFNIYPATGEYSIGKVNENIDSTELYKSYRFQETLLEDTVLFDNFLGTIVGNINSDPNTIGKKVYEKISNFVDNNTNPLVCNIPALVGLYQEFGQDITQFDKSTFAYPANISRLMDLLSIKQTKLWGTRNKNAINYNKRGTVNSEVYGINLGDRIDFYTTVLTAGSASAPIVAYEKFSEKYKLLNTDILSGNYVTFKNPTVQTYALSTYNTRWGWNLVLPDDFTVDEVNNSYIFYEYIPTYANNQVEGVINWNDPLTTISETLSTKTDWQHQAENMLTYQLFKGLKLITDEVNANP